MKIRELLFVITLLFLLVPAVGGLQFKHIVVDPNFSGVDIKAVGDFDGDNLTDMLAAGSGGGIAWYKNPSLTKHVIDAGGQGKWSTDAEAADVDNDSDQDVIVSDWLNNQLVWFENIGKDNWPRHVMGSPRAHDIEVGDLDKDGLIDAVGRQQGSAGKTIVIWKQNSPSSWTQKIINTISGEGLHLGDIDLDGDKDIIIAGRWFENNGSISANWSEHIFSSNWPSGAAQFPWMADIDNDSRPDIVLTPSESAGGTGKTVWFKAPVDPKSANWVEYIIEQNIETVTHSIGVADFDKDGDQDVMTAEMHQSVDPDEVRIYLNEDGIGGSWKKEVIDTYGSHNARVLDVGGDGDFDIFGGNWGGGDREVDLWENLLNDNRPLDNWTYIKVDDSRSPSPYQGFFGLAMGDLTNDSYGDIVSGKYFYRNPGGDMSSVWARVTFPDSPASKPYDALLIGNIDNDSFGDIIAMDGTGKVYWLESEDMLGSSWKSIQVGDLGSADHGISSQGYAWGNVIPGGRPEIIINVAGIYYLEIPANPEAGNWPQTKIATSYFEGVGVGDIDKDGDIDIGGNAGGTSYNTVAWWENPSNSTPDWVKYNVGSTPDKYADRFYAADVSGDDKLDFVVSAANGNNNGIYWFEQPADPKSSNWSRHTVVDYGSANSMNSLDIADMDGDRDIDITSHTMSGRVAIWENSGAGNFIEHVVDSGKGGHLGARVSDLDNDGDLEIVSIEWTGPNLHLWRNDAIIGLGCSSDSECDPTQKCCNNSCVTPTCTASSGCAAAQQCIYAATCNAACQNIQCPEGAITSPCYCGGAPKTAGSGYCCSNVFKTTACSACTQGATQSCDTGLLGVCSAGTKTCQSNGTWGNCIQSNQPTTEICSGDLDEDCDGATDCSDADCFSTAGCQTTIPTDYISWWKFEGNANDEKGANNGTLVNGANIVTDPNKGQVANFDGTDDYLDLGSNTSIDNIWNNKGTILLWLYPKTLSITDQRIFSKGDESIVSLVLNEGNGAIEFRTGPYPPTATTTGISPGKWTHIAVTYDNSATLNGLKIYFDSKLQPLNTVTPETINDAPYNLIIGSDKGTRRYFQGKIDNILIYNRALTATEIQAIYNQTTQPQCTQDSDCPTDQKCCNQTCTTPACASNSDCNAGQQCINAGQCNANCQNIQCNEGAITSACYCQGTAKTTGYCCNNTHQPTPCQECIDNTKLVDYISQWKQGNITMQALMQKMKQWKAGAGCSG